MTLDLGQHLGRYRILSLLGSGGMGDVYRAHDSRLDREVALKFLKPMSTGRDAAAILAEARAASALSHANVCHLHEVDEAEGHTFLVMELVEGQTLAAAIANGPLAADRVTRYGAQIAAALDHAHQRGIVHRDLKAANVMVTRDGHAKVLDFGIARRSSTQLAETTRSVAPFERDDQIAGTLAYMAPEVIQSAAADARSDIWALGIVLFEMIAGRRPFDGASPFDLASAIVNAPTPELPPHTPAGLRTIVNRCLRKVPGERYQHAAEVAAALDAAAIGASPGATTSARTPLLALVALTVVLAAAAAWWWRPWQGAQSSPAIRSLAVLPFADLSPGQPSEYLAEGVTDAIITELGQLGALRVISRTSSMRFRDTTKSIPEIARELDVDAVLEGTLVRDGEHVRVSARLIRAATESSLWSGSYDRQLRDLLALQRDFARTVTQELRLTLTPDQQSRLARQQPVNPAAMEAYLQGRYQWFKRTPAAVAAAIALFEQAIKADPSYAAPHAGLASSYVLLGLSEMSLVPGAESQQRAKSAAAHALALDPRTPEAHTALAYAELWSWNLEASERSFLLAIELNPSDATTRFWYAVRLAAEERFDEAITQATEGQRLDPVSPIITAGLSWVYHLGGRHAEAAQSARQVLALEPEFLMGLRRLGIAYLHLSQYESAAQTLERALVVSGRHPDAFSQLGQTYALQGRASEARKLLAELDELSKTRFVPAYDRALIHAGLKQRDEAFYWLEQAYNERHGALALLAVDPDVNLLRDDPRFDELVRKVGLRPGR
jgi:serine/threonine protein kinase/tetratricopeptide (TPR) repeat protein